MKVGDPGSDPYLGKVQRALDVMTRRQTLVASNVSNLDTPGYRTVDIEFNAALADAVAAPDGPPGETAAARAERVRGLVLRNDGNNVDLDREMLAMGEVRSRYEAATAMLRFHVRQLRTAITEGRTG